MHNRIKALLVSLGLVLSVGLVAAPQASAGTCTAGVLCGVVTNSGSSDYNVVITNDWPRPNGATLTLRPGQSSKNFGSKWKDADGYYITGGKSRLPVRKWTKINNLQRITIVTRR